MKKIIINTFHCFNVSLITICSLTVKADAQVTLTFEDVPGGSIQNSNGDMPSYQGFSFSSTLDWIDVVGSSWNYGARSGDFAILNNNSGVGTITATDGSDFTFDGLWAKRWSTPPESGGADSLFGVLEGYSNGVEVWSVTTGLNGSYEFYGAQAATIDELRLGFGNNFLVDDVMLTIVPEPSTYALISALVVFCAVTVKRRSLLSSKATNFERNDN